jgi:hypothetical protein
MNPTVGNLPPFHPRSNLGLNAPGWSGKPGEQGVAYVLSFTPPSSTLIPTNTFGMTNPPLSFEFTPGGGQFHTLSDPQPRSTPVGGNLYNPHHNIPTGMVPNQPLMNQFGGGFYNPGHGHGAYQNPGWAAIPQQQYILGAWGQMSQPRLPFMATLNLPGLSRLMNYPMCHDPTWPPVPTKISLNILKFEGKTGEDLGNHVTTFHLWCSSSSLNDNYICLRLFQCTLTGVATKWYIELLWRHTKLLIRWF